MKRNMQEVVPDDDRELFEAWKNLSLGDLCPFFLSDNDGRFIRFWAFVAQRAWETGLKIEATETKLKVKSNSYSFTIDFNRTGEDAK